MIRLRRLIVVLTLIFASAPVAGLAVTADASPAGAATGPSCTFNGSALPIVTGASAGQAIHVKCTGLPPLHPYLMMETSLLLGIDPAAAPLLSGQLVSLPGLLSLLHSLPEVNPLALTFPLSDLGGNLDFTYVLPTSLALDPNATCPPTTAQIHAGLIGCALATIDLTSFKPVGAASGIIEFTGDPLFPPGPTLALSPALVTRGQTVAVGDAPGATTYWWLSTLLALEGLLGGGSTPTPTVTVTLTSKRGVVVTVPNTIHVAPAVYNRPVLTPPKLSGTFTVPARRVLGRQTVTVNYGAVLLGFPLSNTASTQLLVSR